MYRLLIMKNVKIIKNKVGFILVSLLLLSCIPKNKHEKISKPKHPNFMGRSIREVENNPDWKVLRKAKGDLNEDGLLDAAIILESKDSILTETRYHSFPDLRKNKPRIMLVLINQNNINKVISQNNKIIKLGDEGGMLMDLEPEIAIENGLLTITYQYTRSVYYYTFEYNNDCMMIKHMKSFGVSGAGSLHEDFFYDFASNEIIEKKKKNYSYDTSWKTKIIQFNDKPKCLSEFGYIYRWKLAENHSL